MKYRAGMFVYALAFLLGVVVVQQLAVLPTVVQVVWPLTVFVAVAIVAGIFISRNYTCYLKQYTLIVSCILLFLTGYIFASTYAIQQLTYRLNDDIVGENLLVKGAIVGIPVDDGTVQRFELQVEKLQIIGANNKIPRLHNSLLKPLKKIRLSWYYGQPVSAADTWQFEVRLKPPHGFLNPGGFDYEGWLFQHGIQATGYIRKSALNQKQSVSSNNRLLPNIDNVRQKLGSIIDDIAQQSMQRPGQHLSQQTSAEKSNSFALIKALAIGDKSAISKQQWQILSATGTSHLMAISGLHIGLAALFAYLFIRRLVPVSLIKTIPAQHVALIASVVMALLYALIAGLSVPTQRAFVMLLVLSMMMLIRRNHRPIDALGFALILVLLVDPLAVLSAGFWFSFSAVAVIFISLDSYSTESIKQDRSPTESRGRKVVFVLKKWVRLQLLISLFLLPLSLFMFQQVSLVSPLANLLLIPYVSFFVVPLVLLAMCLTYISPDIAIFLFSLAATLLDLIWPVLTYLSELPYALWIKGDVGIVELLMATSALSMLYFSRYLAGLIKIISNDRFSPASSYSVIIVIASGLIIPLFYENNTQLLNTEYKVTVLDVGQGSAAVVQTKNHVLVFDTGAKFSKKLDAGSSVVVPYLRSQGVVSIDRLIISHGDADHIGGAVAVLDAYPDTLVIGAGFPVRSQPGKENDKPRIANRKPCVAGMKWSWDGVDFKILSPVERKAVVRKAVLRKTAIHNQNQSGLNQNIFPAGKRNNQSCVLKISSAAGSTLFTGDIEKIVEQQLVLSSAKLLKSDLLIVPHHGSKTSSSAEFIDAVNAEISIFSVGYKNRYKLPNKKVVSRYRALQSTLLRTDKTGAVTITFSTRIKAQIELYRQQSKRYWHHMME